MNEIQRITDQAINESLNGANLAWKKMAYECLRQLCLVKETFTMNDLRDEVNKSSIKTHDNRAMGGIVKSARASGLIVPTGNSIMSKVGHKSPLQIWKSTIFKAKKTLF